MLIHNRKSVLLSLTSTDLPVWSVTKTTATLEQKDGDKFNLLLTVPPLPKERFAPDPPQNPRLLWLEISPYRVTMTMQAIASLNYRHFWEQGVYGISDYWLNGGSVQECERMRLRNFTRRLTLVGRPLPQLLRVEYELWSEAVKLGTYILNLEIH